MQTDIEGENKKALLVQLRKDQILAAAKLIFAQNGYRCTKIEQISDYLNIGKGTIYRYFNDKKALFLAVFEQGLQQLRERMQTLVEPISDPARKIAVAVKNYFEFFDNDPELIEIQMQVRSEFKNEFKQFYIALYSDYIVKIQEDLRKGIKMGIFREDMDVEKTAETISATLQGVLQSFYIREFEMEKQSSEKSIPEREKQLLSSRTGAVTALLLEGVLKRENIGMQKK